MNDKVNIDWFTEVRERAMSFERKIVPSERHAGNTKATNDKVNIDCFPEVRERGMSFERKDSVKREVCERLKSYERQIQSKRYVRHRRPKSYMFTVI